MAKRIRRFDRWMRPGEDTEVIPAVTDDVKEDLNDDLDAVFEPADDDADVEPKADDGRLPSFADHFRERATQLGQRLVELGAAFLVWLGNELRTRLPQFGKALRPRLTRLGAAILAGLLLCSSYPSFNWWWAAVVAFAVLAWVLTRPATAPLADSVTASCSAWRSTYR